MQLSSHGTAIHLYSIEVVPELDRENMRMVRTLLRPHRELLEKTFGAYITSGFMLFGKKHVTDDVDFESEANGEEYAIALQHAGSFQFKLG